MLSFTIESLDKLVLLMLQSVLYGGCEPDVSFFYSNETLHKKLLLSRIQFRQIDVLDEESGGLRPTANEEPYGSRVNGSVQQPWPIPKAADEKMFHIPKSLQIGDNIAIAGFLRDNHSNLTVNLIAGGNSIDYDNVALQFSVQFGANTDSYALHTIKDGNRELAWEETAEKLFVDSNFKFDITINVNSNSEEMFIFDFFCNDNMLGQVEAKHQLADVKYLTLTGDVEKVKNLSFDFA